jgi:predicted lipase
MRAAIRVDLDNYGDVPVYLVGHSLGASMAALAAPMLKQDLDVDIINLYTFGSPRTGNQVRTRCLCSVVHEKNAVSASLLAETCVKEGGQEQAEYGLRSV